MKMGDKLKAQLNKFKYPLLALVLGLIIMLLPIGESSSRSVSSQTDEQPLAAVLQRCDGVGNVTRFCPIPVPLSCATARMMPRYACQSSRLLKLSRAFQATVFR